MNRLGQGHRHEKCKVYSRWSLELTTLGLKARVLEGSQESDLYRVTAFKYNNFAQTMVSSKTTVSMLDTLLSQPMVATFWKAHEM